MTGVQTCALPICFPVTILKLVIGAGETASNVLSAVETFITAHGWSVHDASAGTNAKAYSAPNKDGSTYKYVVLDVNTAGYIIMKLYESWNATTHAGTNLATNSDSTSYCQQLDVTNGSTLYVGAHARWLWLLSNKSGTLGSSTGNSPTFIVELS